MALNVSHVGTTYRATASGPQFYAEVTGTETSARSLSLSGSVPNGTVTMTIAVDPVAGLTGTVNLDYVRTDLPRSTFTVLSASHVEWAIDPASWVGKWTGVGRAVSCTGVLCPPNLQSVSNPVELDLQQTGQAITGFLVLVNDRIPYCCPGIPVQGRVNGTTVVLDGATLSWDTPCQICGSGSISHRVEVAATSFQRETDTTMQGSITYTSYPYAAFDDHMTLTSTFTLRQVLP